MQAADYAKRPTDSDCLAQAASHKSLSIPDLMYHSQQIDFDGMRQLCADIMPYEWSHMDEPMVWFEMESNARYPAFHTGCVMGKS